jgi:hypothetical protein
VLTFLLHLSFVSPLGHADCLGGYLPPETAAGDQFRLLRIQVWGTGVSVHSVRNEDDECGVLRR